MRALPVLAFFLLVGSCPAQSLDPAQHFERAGRWYVYWGWNRAIFTPSDIHFKGPGYDFTLMQVQATDKPKDFTVKGYLDPVYAPIPQYNFRIGYFIRNKYNVSFGVDHMKYVVDQYQTVRINGTISGTESVYDGSYSDQPVVIKPDFLQFEHTDGLNYVNTELRRSDEVISFEHLNISLTEGLGIGVLYPKTNVTLLNHERNDQFHVSGYGISGMVGMNIEFYRSFFIQTEIKGGYINMPDIRTTNSASDKADQHFYFGQLNVVLGASFHLGKKHRPMDATGAR